MKIYWELCLKGNFGARLIIIGKNQSISQLTSKENIPRQKCEFFFIEIIFEMYNIKNSKE